MPPSSAAAPHGHSSRLGDYGTADTTYQPAARTTTGQHAALHCNRAHYRPGYGNPTGTHCTRTHCTRTHYPYTSQALVTPPHTLAPASIRSLQHSLQRLRARPRQQRLRYGMHVVCHPGLRTRGSPHQLLPAQLEGPEQRGHRRGAPSVHGQHIAPHSTWPGVQVLVGGQPQQQALKCKGARRLVGGAVQCCCCGCCVQVVVHHAGGQGRDAAEHVVQWLRAPGVEVVGPGRREGGKARKVEDWAGAREEGRLKTGWG